MSTKISFDIEFPEEALHEAIELIDYPLSALSFFAMAMGHYADNIENDDKKAELAEIIYNELQKVYNKVERLNLHKM